MVCRVDFFFDFFKVILIVLKSCPIGFDMPPGPQGAYSILGRHFRWLSLNFSSTQNPSKNELSMKKILNLHEKSSFSCKVDNFFPPPTLVAVAGPSAARSFVQPFRTGTGHPFVRALGATASAGPCPCATVVTGQGVLPLFTGTSVQPGAKLGHHVIS